MARSKNSPTTAVDSIRHGETRKNIPTNELRDFLVEYEAAPAVVRYPRDPSLDPQLVWKGMDERDSRDLAVSIEGVSRWGEVRYLSRRGSAVRYNDGKEDSPMAVNVVSAQDLVRQAVIEVARLPEPDLERVLAYIDELKGQHVAPPTREAAAEGDAQESELGRQLRAIRQRIVAAGDPLLDWQGVADEVAERRGER